MANINAPFGFRPYDNTSVNQFSPGYTIASAYNTAIYYGDPVKSTGTGTDGLPGIQLGTTNALIRGVFRGVYYLTPSSGTTQMQFQNYWAAGTTSTYIRADVYDSPNQVFSIQVNTTFANADIGNTADFATGTGSVITGSGYTLDISSLGTGANLYILGAIQTGQEIGSYTVVNVLIKEHELRDLTAL